MKVIPVSPHATEINGLLDQARHEEVLLQSADGSEFLLVAVDDFCAGDSPHTSERAIDGVT